jgi:hypothetical protein
MHARSRIHLLLARFPIRMFPRDTEPYAICLYQLSIPYLLTFNLSVTASEHNPFYIRPNRCLKSVYSQQRCQR